MTTCQVCLGETVRELDKHRYAEHGGSYVLCECVNCGSLFTDPMPGDARLADYYKENFNYQWYRDHYSAKLRDARIRVEEYSGLLGDKVLDFGGGVGYFSKAVIESGKVSLTYDPYTADVPLENDEWDTVVSLHALEHSNNLDRTVQHIKGLVRRGGNVIIAVPNYGGLGYEREGMNWVWAQPPLLHIFHFSPMGLRLLLERNGFSNIVLTSHERWDANKYCDIDNVDRTRRIDAQWGAGAFSRFSMLRKYIAWRNARYRFDGLRRSSYGISTSDLTHSELQAVAWLI